MRYQIVVERDGVSVVTTTEHAPDLTFVCDYATAAALARGETNAQDALMSGRLRLRGDIERFSSARDALVAVGDVFGRVRGGTEF